MRSTLLCTACPSAWYTKCVKNPSIIGFCNNMSIVYFPRQPDLLCLHVTLQLLKSFVMWQAEVGTSETFYVIERITVIAVLSLLHSGHVATYDVDDGVICAHHNMSKGQKYQF